MDTAFSQYTVQSLQMRSQVELTFSVCPSVASTVSCISPWYCLHSWLNCQLLSSSSFPSVPFEALSTSGESPVIYTLHIHASFKICLDVQKFHSLMMQNHNYVFQLTLGRYFIMTWNILSLFFFWKSSIFFIAVVIDVDTPRSNSEISPLTSCTQLEDCTQSLYLSILQPMHSFSAAIVHVEAKFCPAPYSDLNSTVLKFLRIVLDFAKGSHLFSLGRLNQAVLTMSVAHLASYSNPVPRTWYHRTYFLQISCLWLEASLASAKLIVLPLRC